MGKPGPDRSLDDEEILRAISDAYAPALGTSEIADRVDAERRTVYNYLDRLEDEGYLESDKVGENDVLVWWLTDKGRRRLDPHSSGGDQ